MITLPRFKRNLSWRVIETLCKNLARDITRHCNAHPDTPKPTVVIGIARGGLIPAVLVGRRLKIREMQSIQVVKYDDMKEDILPKITALNTPQVEVLDGADVLLIDDIADEGETLQFAKLVLEKLGAKSVTTAALFRRSTSKMTPDFYRIELETTDWIVFPWEREQH